MVFYEAPHKLSATLDDMCNAFGDREVAVVKEITKLHESVMKTTLFKASEHYKTEKPKGEFVIIVGGKSEQEEEITFEKAVEMARSLMQSGMSVSFAAKEIANSTPYKKGDIYKALL